LSKKAAAPRRYAPAIGADTEFDEQEQKVWEALEASGNPEGITREVSRETLAKRFVEFGGKTYSVADFDLPVEDEEPTGPVTLTDLVIPTAPTDPYWYEDPNQARIIEHYILTRRTLGTAFHGALLITGPAGSGKTMGVPQTVARLNAKHGLAMRLLKMDCATITDPQKWFGRREIDQEGSKYIESDFIQAVREGNVVILLDEITRIHPTIGNIVHSLLDGSQSLHLSELNRTVDVSPTTVFLATANIGAQFGGTHRMDWALRERFGYTIERDFAPRTDEIRILTSHTGCDPDAASVLVDVAIKTRSMYQTGDLRSPISTRVLVNAAWLVASGVDEKEALMVTALPGFDGDANGTVGEKSERASVMAAIELRTGR
jgi:nitric oxide reductase NorQ protein